MESNGKRGSGIQEFYRGKNLFITGGTGFMGKVLVEKLLYSCPDINKIYLLIRVKKDKDVKSRLQELLDGLAFERLRSERPGFRDQVIAVEGDCAKKDLGLSPSDRQTLRDSVDLMFHMAAAIRFDQHLRSAFDINVRATLDVLQLCRECVHLKAFVHLSTAYSHNYWRHMDEALPDPPLTAEKLSNLLDAITNDAFITDITPLLLGDWCNTYTYTKAIAEFEVQNSNIGCPVAIVRPAMVTSSAKEPFPGWLDALIGPIGAFVAIGLGTMHVSETAVDYPVAIVPCDMANNAVIASAWDVCNRERYNRLDAVVYNYVDAVDNQITFGECAQYVVKLSKVVPFDNIFWVPFFFGTSYRTLYLFFAFFLHTLPALLVDIALFCTGKKTRMLKLYKKMNTYKDKTSYFRLNFWKFKNENVKQMWQNISEEDRNIFPFNMRDVDWKEYFYHCMHGFRRFILKQDPNDLSKGFKRRQRFERIQRIVMFSAFAVIVCLLLFFVARCYMMGLTTSAEILQIMYI